MAQIIRLSLVVVSGLLCAASALEAGFVDVVNRVSVTSYRNYLDNTLYTRTGHNRGIGGLQHDLAKNNIFSVFSSFGLNVSLHPFDYGGSTYHNVVATKTGSTRPNDIYVIGAHYDSVDNPGADDNASGVAGVLEAARVLASEPLDATVVFIAFDREEQGLLGSTAYANAHRTDNIVGMISLDMIAYNPATNHNQAYIYWRDDNTSITQDLQDSLARYGNGVTGVINQLAYDASDNVPFDRVGKDACLLIEYNVWSNPNYHKPLDSVDTPGYIDYDYATNMTRGVVGYLAERSLTQAVPEPSSLMLLAVFILPAGVHVVYRRRQKVRAE